MIGGIASKAGEKLGSKPGSTLKNPPTIDTSVPRFIDNVVVNDKLLGKFEGTVDLGPTFDRINAGSKFPHHRDGNIFQNRDSVLPNQPVGYYREYVHQTPGVTGPGVQRVVIGKNGDIYYTPDHYETFIKLK